MMVLGDALTLVCVGLMIGGPVAFWGFAASLIEDLALAAAYLPARRAARVDPMEALRHE